MEKRRAKGIPVERPAGFSIAREDDLISKLPDSLISHILSSLPTKDAVRTSVLSNRWKNLWLLIPRLDLASCEFPDYNDFLSFMNRFVDFSKEQNSCLHELRLSIRKGPNDQSRPTRWIEFAFVATPKLKHLDVEFLLVERDCLEVMPVSLYICEALLYLRLHRVMLGKVESVSLPRLKTMRLEKNVYASDASLELLISSCPLLEDLIIVRKDDDNVKVLRVRSQTLTSLGIHYYIGRDEAEVFDFDKLSVMIDAPSLEYLNLENDLSHSKTISNSGSLTKVNFLGEFYLKASADEVDLRKRYMVRNFFTSISRVRDLNISWEAFEFIEDIMPLPQFCNLTCLEATLYLPSLETLPTLLESFPNLRSLILELLNGSTIEQIRLASVPQCLLSSLKFVEIQRTFRDPAEMELARYFVENSVILKKYAMRLRLATRKEKATILRDLLALPRRSSTCQIVVC